MVVFPSAKINIGLQVVSKREDGYHNLVSLFYPVKWLDVLEFVPSRKKQFIYYGRKIETGGKPNLIEKAYELIESCLPSPLRVCLYKNIPMQAGLGGGSSDAAFFIRSVNDYFNLGLQQEEMEKILLSLGSDCLFFLHNKPALVTGRGENVEPFPISLSHYWIVIVKHAVAISTAEAFASIRPAENSYDLRDALMKPIEEWRYSIKNDFEEYAFRRYPDLAEIKEQLYRQGACYASMTGSGSAIYGIFPDKPVWKGLNRYEHFTAKLE